LALKKEIDVAQTGKLEERLQIGHEKWSSRRISDASSAVQREKIDISKL